MNNNVNFGTSANQFGFLFRLRERFRNLFKKKTAESYRESNEEGRWDDEYRESHEINFAEIFSLRLTNYTLSGSSATCDDENINVPLQRTIAKWYKWVQMAYGVGRVFLIPYVLEGNIYTDIIPQGRAWTTRRVGDDVVGIGVVADIRTVGKETFTRLTSYDWNAETKEFVIENKAIRTNGSEAPLSIVEEWASIEPYILISDVEKPLFAYVDCPKDNRRTDSLQGAPITYGCEETIEQIKKCIRQYQDEFDLKETWLGVDRVMLDKNGQPDNSKLYKTFNGKSAESLFEIFSPDIRDASFRARLLDLFALLEKQVGTSSGILTPAETANATATQVRRAMYDTFSVVDRMRGAINTAIDDLCYIYTVYMRLISIPFDAAYAVTKEWGEIMPTDRAEQFSILLQGHSADAVKTVEIRRFIYPDETQEEAIAAVKEIQESKPEPVLPDFFGE